MMPLHSRRRKKTTLVFTFLVWLISLCLFPAVQSPRGSGPTPQAALFRNTLRVATLNMYVGFDMSPAVNGAFDTANPREVAGLIDKLSATFTNNRPQERIRKMAQELIVAAPDVIGLQEAVSLKLYGFTLGDYVAELAREIRKQGGPDYGILTLDTLSLDGMFRTDPIPAQVTFKDREALLYRKEMRCRSLDAGTIFAVSRHPVEILGQEVALKRGAIGMTCVSHSGRPFYFYNTHLDVITQGPAQEEQARELVNYIRATATDPARPIIVTGDFNAREDLSRTRTYAILREAGFADAFRERFPDVRSHPGVTCCQDELLRNADSIAGGRYDYVFYKGGLNVHEASVFANAPFPLTDTIEKLWPSDHFGVWAEFE